MAKPHISISSSGGSEGSRISSSCGPFPHKRIVTVPFSLSCVDFLKNCFVVSTKLLVDGDVVVVSDGE